MVTPAGDCVKIEQETIDRSCYIVTIMQSGESGSVPKEFVTVDKSTSTYTKGGGGVHYLINFKCGKVNLCIQHTGMIGHIFLGILVTGALACSLLLSLE